MFLSPAADQHHLLPTHAWTCVLAGLSGRTSLHHGHENRMMSGFSGPCNLNVLVWFREGSMLDDVRAPLPKAQHNEGLVGVHHETPFCPMWLRFLILRQVLRIWAKPAVHCSAVSQSVSHSLSQEPGRRVCVSCIVREPDWTLREHEGWTILLHSSIGHLYCANGRIGRFKV